MNQGVVVGVTGGPGGGTALLQMVQVVQDTAGEHAPGPGEPAWTTDWGDGAQGSGGPGGVRATSTLIQD